MIKPQSPLDRALINQRMQIVLLTIGAVLCAQMLLIALIKATDPEALPSIFPAMYMPMAIIPSIVVLMKIPAKLETQQYFASNGKLPPTKGLLSMTVIMF